MIIVRSPYRVSLLGGSTDYNDYILKYRRGMCIGFTIDKYSYVCAQPLREHSRIIYSEIESVTDNSCIQHKAINAAIEKMGMLENYMEITHLSDISANAGLGTSSAMMVALIMALEKLGGKVTDLDTLIQKAVITEQSYSTVGWQDAALSAYGGISKLDFSKSPCGFIVQRTAYDYYVIQRELEKYGLLFYTGITRSASDIVSSYRKKLTSDKVEQIYQLAVEGAKVCEDDYFDIYKLAELINESWEFKRSLSPNIASETINELENALDDAGTFAFKLLGAGGGGTVFCLAEPEMHASVIEAAENHGCTHIPFRITWEGTEVLCK